MTPTSSSFDAKMRWIKPLKWRPHHGRAATPQTESDNQQRSMLSRMVPRRKPAQPHADDIKKLSNRLGRQSITFGLYLDDQDERLFQSLCKPQSERIAWHPIVLPTRPIAAQPKCRFLKLPAELRNAIYKLLYPDTIEPVEIDLMNTAAVRPSRSFLMSCRQIHQEAKHMYKSANMLFWRTHHFILDVRSDCYKQASNMYNARRKHPPTGNDSLVKSSLPGDAPMWSVKQVMAKMAENIHHIVNLKVMSGECDFVHIDARLRTWPPCLRGESLIYDGCSWSEKAESYHNGVAYISPARTDVLPVSSWCNPVLNMIFSKKDRLSRYGLPGLHAHERILSLSDVVFWALNRYASQICVCREDGYCWRYKTWPWNPPGCLPLALRKRQLDYDP